MNLHRGVLVLLLALAPGCNGYRIRAERDPKTPVVTPPATPRRLPVVARIRVDPVLSELKSEGMPPPDRVTPTPDDRKRFARAIASAEIFEKVLEPGDPWDGDEVAVTLRGTLTRMPEFMGGSFGTRFIVTFCVLPILWPLSFLYCEWDPTMEVEWRVDCETVRGRPLGSVSVATQARLEGQIAAGQRLSIFGPDGVRVCMEDAVPLLAARLAADEKVHAAILAAVKPIVPAAPPPVAPVAVAPYAPGDAFVLVVGVNDYADPAIPRLGSAERDARAVYSFFANEKASPANQDRVKILAGAEATRPAILRAIREHLERNAAREDDMVVLYFAGHGFGDAASSYLAGHDAVLAELPETAISAATLREYWGRIRARHKVLITDACRATPTGLRGIGGTRLVPEEEAATLALAATSTDERSTEDAAAGQGVFTLALLRGLRGEADADSDRRITGGELAKFLEREVPALAARAGGKQTPRVDATPAALSFWLTR